MLVNAMEVSGVRGNYEYTCEKVMSVLRSNQDSLMAVLEAFVYDPLINWRLVTNDSVSKSSNENSKSPKTNENKNSNLSIYAVSSSFSPFSTSSSPGGFSGNKQERSFDNENSPKNTVLNNKAVEVVTRIERKLTGRDFDENKTLNVAEQVEKLISQSISNERLCSLFHGWCGFW
jgi:serine/threonine-protein kinase mTOR